MQRKIILDTNFLIAPFQFSFDIFEEIERIYPEPEILTIQDAVQEAKSIEKGKYKSLVDKLINQKNIEVLETVGEGSVDDLMVNISNEYVIATNDKELKERLIQADSEILHIRNGSYLEAINRENLV